MIGWRGGISIGILGWGDEEEVGGDLEGDRWGEVGLGGGLGMMYVRVCVCACVRVWCLG